MARSEGGGGQGSDRTAFSCSLVRGSRGRQKSWRAVNFVTPEVWRLELMWHLPALLGVSFQAASSQGLEGKAKGGRDQQQRSRPSAVLTTEIMFLVLARRWCPLMDTRHRQPKILLYLTMTHLSLSRSLVLFLHHPPHRRTTFYLLLPPEICQRQQGISTHMLQLLSECSWSNCFRWEADGFVGRRGRKVTSLELLQWVCCYTCYTYVSALLHDPTKVGVWPDRPVLRLLITFIIISFCLQKFR